MIRSAGENDSKKQLVEAVMPIASSMGLSKELVELACETKTNPDEVVGYIFENQAQLEETLQQRKLAGNNFVDNRINSNLIK